MRHMYPVELNGPRVKLREFRADDADALFTYATDPKVLERTHWQIFKPEDAGHWISHMQGLAMRQPRVEYQWALTVPPDDTPVGGARLRVESEQSQRGSIGYILSPGYWGKGLVTEAASIVVEFALQTLKLHRVEALVEPSNGPSWRVLERIGMTREGLLRDYLMDRDRWVDAYIYATVTDR
jgi:[ribosomal protein S5]-alanine N-acetyltransferase